MKTKGQKMQDKLLSAIEQHDVVAVRALLQDGVKVGRVRTRLFSKSESPLVTAALENAVEIVQLLLDYGADLDEVGYSVHLTALEAAAYKGNLESCKLLLSCMEKSERSYKHKLSALIKAVIYGHKEIVTLFLDAGVNPNDVCSYPRITFFRIHGDVLRQLVEAGGVLPDDIMQMLEERTALGDTPDVPPDMKMFPDES